MKIITPELFHDDEKTIKYFEKDVSEEVLDKWYC